MVQNAPIMWKLIRKHKNRDGTTTTRTMFFRHHDRAEKRLREIRSQIFSSITQELVRMNGAIRGKNATRRIELNDRMIDFEKEAYIERIYFED
jgi:hypothetical protein|tara:strand:- start:150 stop:428 length:279 start_codon:yes stop_codon:yes gene_type:complete